MKLNLICMLELILCLRMLLFRCTVPPVWGINEVLEMNGDSSASVAHTGDCEHIVKSMERNGNPGTKIYSTCLETNPNRLPLARNVYYP